MRQITAFEEMLNIYCNTYNLDIDIIVEYMAENMAETKDDLAKETKELLSFINQNIKA